MAKALIVIVEILKFVGLPTLVWLFRDNISVFAIRHMQRKKTLAKKVKEIALAHSVPYEMPKGVGIFSPVAVKWYIDLMWACTKLKTLNKLTQYMVGFLHMSVSTKFDRIAVPKLGNVVLATAVARTVHVPLVVVRQVRTIQSRADTPFDGETIAGERILLIDDVASDHLFLTSCISILRSASLQVSDVVVLLNRKEGHCIDKLSKMNVEFHKLFDIDDAGIDQLRLE